MLGSVMKSTEAEIWRVPHHAEFMLAGGVFFRGGLVLRDQISAERNSSRIEFEQP